MFNRSNMGWFGFPPPPPPWAPLRTEDRCRVEPSMRWCHDPPPVETQKRGANTAALVDLREGRDVDRRRQPPGELQHLRALPPPPATVPGGGAGLRHSSGFCPDEF